MGSPGTSFPPFAPHCSLVFDCWQGVGGVEGRMNRLTPAVFLQHQLQNPVSQYTALWDAHHFLCVHVALNLDL